MREVRLDDVDAAVLEHLLELPPGEHPLAGGDRDRRVGRDRRQGVVVFWEDRLLDEHRFVRFERLREAFCHRRARTTVEIHSHVDLGADGLAYLREPITGGLDGCGRVDSPELARSVHLQPRKPLRYLLLRGFADIGGPVAADPLVDADPIARPPSE